MTTARQNRARQVQSEPVVAMRGDDRSESPPLYPHQPTAGYQPSQLTPGVAAASRLMPRETVLRGRREYSVVIVPLVVLFQLRIQRGGGRNRRTPPLNVDRLGFYASAPKVPEALCFRVVRPDFFVYAITQVLLDGISSNLVRRSSWM